MSSYLYDLGRWCFRRHRRVLALWLIALVALGGAAGLLGGKYNDNFDIPGAPAAMALAKLQRTFPQAAAQSATAIVTVPEGTRIDAEPVKTEINNAVAAFAKVPHVAGVSSPFSTLVSGQISQDGRSALITMQLDTANFADITDADRAALTAEAQQVQRSLPAGSQVNMGGQAFSIEVPSLSITEAYGLVVALVVLLFTLGSMLAAGLPLLTAVLGVGVTMAIMTVAARLTTVNSTTPMLAVMLGLAVGIDYALFILSRHRDQLREGMDVEESAARAVATAGSAVVFAGLTVVIALLGLLLANIPFLGVMGVFAAIGVAVAVIIALTLLPALMGFLGERMRPKASTKPKAAKRAQAMPRIFRTWVRAAVKWPVVTILLVAAALGALSIPAANLFVGLPNSGDHQPGQADRITFDQIAARFGPGYNGPIIVTADIIASTDPLGVMKGLKSDIAALPGVALVPLATPNQNADTGFVQVVPTTGPSDPATKTLVNTLRAQHDTWLSKYGVNTAVTGSTAIQIDVSDRLSKALLPFGIFVVGLSLILLTMVFRSLWVPLKATVGFLLSIGAAFGTTHLVFNKGWAHQLINLEKPGPVIAFLPILAMGILFGLAMDYEVFLVSRIREDFVHAVRAGVAHKEAAHQAIETGFVASAKVVLAAALIMFSVFAFFVPEGTGPIKSIAFALAVGVAIDAFVVRMTLVPAVLALLGAHAWTLPGWLDRRLPSLDVEGESLSHQLSLANWPTPDHTEAAYLDHLGAGDLFAPISLELQPGQVAVMSGANGPREAALLALTGRLGVDAGRARVAGDLLPERAARVRRRTAVIRADASNLAHDIDAAMNRNPRLIVLDQVDALTDTADLDAVVALVQRVRQPHPSSPAPAVILGCSDAASLAEVRPDVSLVVQPHSFDGPSPTHENSLDTTTLEHPSLEGSLR